MPWRLLNEMEEIRVEIHKKERTLRVYNGKSLIKTFAIALGFAPDGGKQVEGDGRTPEGSFYVFTKNPESKFHLSLGLSYPSVDDAERGVKVNLISNEESDSIKKAISEKRKPLQYTQLGGEIYIHGGGVESDWTDGCVALKNEEIAELFELIPVGAVVEIHP
jgi:murein L,D-transpeptidase YafK